MNYLFDIDGTLTAPRSKMTKENAKEFIFCMKNKTFYLITGSDFIKVIEQLPLSVVSKASYVFCCLGNEIYKPIDEISYTKVHQANNDWPNEIIDYCQRFVNNSEYSEKYGNHIEKRVGVINVSSVGRNALPEQRKSYFDWDVSVQEREKFVKSFNNSFSEFEASIGGMISIDITLKGCNKRQALDWVGWDVVFFGDRIEEGGNDYPLADRISLDSRGISYSVSGPEETIDILKQRHS